MFFFFRKNKAQILKNRIELLLKSPVVQKQDGIKRETLIRMLNNLKEGI